MPIATPDAPASTRTVPEQPNSGGGGGGGIATVPFDSSILLVPNDTFSIFWFSPGDITISAIKLYYVTAGVTAGAYTLAGTGAGNNLLSAATLDITAGGGAGVADGVLTTMTLTATAADLALAVGNVVQFDFVSDNVDLTFEGGYLQVLYGAT